MVPEVRSAGLSRDGHGDRSGRHEAVLGARLPRAGGPPRLASSRQSGDRRQDAHHDRQAATAAGSRQSDIACCSARRIAMRTARTGSSPARRSKGSRSAASGSTAPAPTIPTTSSPHEHRRELRAYGTFAAWVNHVDSKSINTLDTLIEQDGRKVVRHHLLDFGSTDRQRRRVSARGVRGLGIPRRGQEGAHGHARPSASTSRTGAPSPSIARARSARSPSITRIGTRRRWKPRYANSAFRSARLDDKFWAARRLQGFTDEMLKAVTRVGQFNDPTSEQMLAKFLIDRRNAIVRRYLTAVNPILNVQLTRRAP